MEWNNHAFETHTRTLAKSKMVVATHNHAMYARGTHTHTPFTLTRTNSRRYVPPSCVLCGRPILSPYRTFALLVPAQLHLLFGHKYHGLRALARCMRKRCLACNGHDRVPFLAMISDDVDTLPVCAKYAGIVPMACTLTNLQTVAMHRMLVTIWQEHIKSFHEGEHAHQNYCVFKSQN